MCQLDHELLQPLLSRLVLADDYLALDRCWHLQLLAAEGRQLQVSFRRQIVPRG